MIKTIKEFAMYWWVELSIFCIMCLRLASLMPSPSSLGMGMGNGHILFPYLMSYRFGFGSRFFIGSLIQLFTNSITIKLVWTIATTATILLIGLVALFVGKASRQIQGNGRNALLAIVAVYIGSPLGTQFFEGSIFGRMELFLQILVLVMLVCLQSRRAKWLIPILSVVCVAIYQNFVFLYLAPFLVVLLFDNMKSADKNKIRSGIALFAVTAIAASVAFCLFQFNKQLNVDSPQEMLAAISTYSDIPLDERPLKLEYFVNMDYHFEHFILDLEGGYGWAVLSVRFILSVVFFSPLIIFLAVFWRKCVRSEQSKLGKWVYRLAALSPLAALPAFVLTVDYGRWICAIFFMQFTMLLYSLYIQDNNAKAVLAEIYEFVVPKRVAAYFVVLLYFMSIGQIYAVAILRDISIIGKIGKKVLEILF